MARNIKSGLDYFPLDVDTDDKFELIEAKHELIGFAIIIKLFQRIYKAGYYLEWNDEKLLIFKKSINVDINTINDVINDCLKYGIFNEALFKKYKILTSSGIQKRYLQACERRKILNLHKEFIIVDINEKNVNINWINDDKSTQRKEKESKEKESKEEIIKETCFSFNEFWDIYPKKVDKKEAEKKYAKLSEEKRQKIKDTIDAFIVYKPFPTYNLPNPSTYINKERWNDVITPEQNKDPFYREPIVDRTHGFSVQF